MHEQYVPGSLFSSPVQEPGNENTYPLTFDKVYMQIDVCGVPFKIRCNQHAFIELGNV